MIEAIEPGSTVVGEAGKEDEDVGDCQVSFERAGPWPIWEGDASIDGTLIVSVYEPIMGREGSTEDVGAVKDCWTGVVSTMLVL